MYADHSTRNISLSDAILFTRKWIMGCSEEDFNQVLLFLKKGSDASSKSSLAIRDKEGNVLRHIPFPLHLVLNTTEVYLAKSLLNIL